jgi:hypothetical protein
MIEPVAKQKLADCAYLVRFTAAEDRVIQAKAKAAEMTVSGVLRAGVGLPPLDRGGARPGGGRPKGSKNKPKDSE